MIAALTAASPEELASIRALLALPKAAKAPKAEKAAKVPKTKAEKVALPLPEGCPTASDYRLDASEIDHSLCVGRDLSGGEDKRFKPTIYRERQCGKPAADGDLCKTCAKRCAKYEESGKQGPWNGRVTEEPLDGCHMLGTAWAETKKPVFGAGSAAASAAASAETSDAEEAKAEPQVKPAKETKEPTKATPAKETKKAEKPAKEPKVKAEKPKEPKAKTAPIALALAPSGIIFATLSSDKSIRIFDFKLGKLLRKYDESLAAYSANDGMTAGKDIHSDDDT
jgi:hypothetical protein